MDDGRSDAAGAPGAHDAVDLCIVGGGVAATTAALFARELGLATVLLEQDDALTGFRASTRDLDPGEIEATIASLSEFPRAQAFAARMIEELASAASIQRTRQRLQASGAILYRGGRVVSLGPDERAGFRLRVSEFGDGEAQEILAHTVLLAPDGDLEGEGARSATRGSEIPGQALPELVSGIGDEAPALEPLLSRPVLVIGSNAAAVSAVIAVSNAKADRGRGSDVYWLHEIGPQAPTPSDALAGWGDAFLNAWTNNGNIHSLAGCEMIGASSEAPRVPEQIAFRMSSAPPGGAPHQGLLYEFDRDCILNFVEASAKHAPSEGTGANGLRALLADFGVPIEVRAGRPLATIDTAGRLETPGLYIAGDVLGDRVLRCRRFDTSGAEASEVRRRPGAVTSVAEALRVLVDRFASARESLPASAATPSGSAPALVDPTWRWQLVSLRSDGSIEAAHAIRDEVTEIGRKAGGIAIPDDAHMADHHASLVADEGELFIADSGAGSGVWLRVGSSDGAELDDEDQVWVGKQILVAIRGDEGWSLAHYGAKGQLCGTYEIGSDGVYVGRGSELPLDLDDTMLSRRHAQFRVEGDFLKVYDRGARNGTFVKIQGAAPLSLGDEFRIATQCFRLEKSTAGPGAGDSSPSPIANTWRGGEVRLDDDAHPVVFSLDAGKSILQGFIEAGGRQNEPIAWECQTGGCGLCAVEIVSGAEHLGVTARDSDEMKTIAKTAGITPDPSRHRLACLARINGPVVLRRLR